MPFRDFTTRVASVLTGRVTKRQPTTPSRHGSKSVSGGRNLTALPSPPSTVKVRNGEGVIKEEPAADGCTDPFLNLAIRKQLMITAHEEMRGDIVLPSVERSPSPVDLLVLSSIEQPQADALRGRDPGAAAHSSDSRLPHTSPTHVIHIMDGDGSGDEKEQEYFRPEKSPDMVSDGWDIPEDVLEKYESSKSAVRGSDSWTSTESHLHKLLGLRGHHPLISAEWKRDFTGLNLEEILFAPFGSEQTVALRSISPGMAAQFRATKALGRIFALPARVGDLRRAGDPARSPRLISTLIEREIIRYIRWAENDAGLDKLYYASNLGVYRLSDADSSEGELTEHITALMADWAEGYRRWYVEMGIKGAPRTLFALVILQHVVFILTQDASDPQGTTRFLAELDLSRSDGRWLDYALNLVIPVNLAREAMVRAKDSFPEKPDEPDSDPDA